jgi:hypothetical protein
MCIVRAEPPKVFMAVSIDTESPDEVQDERSSSETSFLTDEVFEELKNQATHSCILCELEEELEDDDWE